MSEMVDRVELAINEETNRINSLPRDERVTADRQMGGLLAMAAIKAMREPTAFMLIVGYKHTKDAKIDIFRDVMIELWQAMIDEALK